MAATIRGINVQIGSDTTGLSKALSDVNKNARDIQNELRQVERLLKLDPTNTELLAQKQQLLASAVQNTQEKLDRLRSVQEQVNEQFKKGEINEDQYRAYQREVIKTEENLKSLESQLKEMGPSAERLGEQFEAAGEKMKQAGEKMSDAGKSLTMKVTAPIVGIGAASTKAAIDFESAFAGVRKTVDATEEEFSQLEQGIRDMSKLMPASASDIAAVAEAAGQLGIETPNILKFTETMIGLGEATNLTAEEAATQFARFANIVGMSQGDFDRLGSAVVALGNSFATTEAEIVAMGMRLAAQGKQVGMTEAEIAALATTMSSLGIEAEAGGTAMTTTLKRIQTAVAEGGAELDAFARVARMSANDFAKEFQNRPIKALDAFVRGLSQSSKEGDNLTTVLSDLGIKGIRESDTLLRMAGASELLAKAVETSTEAWEENSALADEVAQRYETTESKLAMAKNQLVDLGIDIGNILIPVLLDLVENVKSVVQWFAGLDRDTQKTIITIAGLAAAVGPLLMGLGALTSSISSIVGLFGKLIPIVAGAATGLGGLSGVLAAITGPVGLAVAGIAALTAGGIALYKHLKEESIPEIERFGSEVSEATQEAVGAFMDLNDQATLALNQLSWSSQEVTQEMANAITGTFNEMGAQILSSMEERHAEELASMQSFFAEAQGLTEAEQNEILEKVRQSQEDQKLAVKEAQERIKEILETASEEKRALTAEEAEEINQLQQNMLNTGIEMMSENELEQKAILERMKANAVDLTARQAAEVVQNSIKQRDETIQAAEDQYNDVVKQIIRQRDELGTISEEQAEKLIQEAQRQRDEVILRAMEMHESVVDEAKKQAKEHVDAVDWETGEIKTRWEKLKDNIASSMLQIFTNVSQTFSKKISDIKTKMTEIGDAIKSGWNEVIGWLKGLGSRMKEVGKDIMDGLKSGISNAANAVWDTAKDVGSGIANGFKNFFGIQSPSRLMMGYGKNIGEGLAIGIKNSVTDVEREMSALNAAVSDVSARAEFDSATSQSQSATRSSGDVIQHITINSPTPLSPSEVARKNMQASRQLAMEWGMR